MNYWSYVIDWWTNVFAGKPEEWGAYPLMYKNLVPDWVLGQKDGNIIWGPFVWYDMFSF